MAAPVEAFEGPSAAAERELEALAPGKFPVMYHPSYNMSLLGLEKLSPFDSKRYSRVFKMMVEMKLLPDDRSHIEPPGSMSAEELQVLHSPKHLADLETSRGICRILEVPLCVIPVSVLRSAVLLPMQRATKGSVYAAHLAAFGERGWALNLGGGYHHAGRSHGHGFCVYADITAAVRSVQARWRRQYAGGEPCRAMIVDLDAHRGDGHETDFLGDDSVYVFDCYTAGIFPGEDASSAAIRTKMHFRKGDRGEHFLPELRDKLSRAVEAFQPHFVVYNAGTDCLEGDPLSGLSLSPEAVVERDEIVFASCGFQYRSGAMAGAEVPAAGDGKAEKKFVPVCILPSGGYQMKCAGIIADSLKNLNEKFGIFQPDFKRPQ